jgi:EXPERA (EXPanded EBP superfamily)
MRDMPPWFKCLVWMEVALQLPFFFVGAYAFLLRRNWIRTPALLYGINVTSTMVRRCSLLSVPHGPRWLPGTSAGGLSLVCS